MNGEESALRSVWRCGGCQAPLGQVMLGPGVPYLLVESRQLSGRVNLPVTRLCGRCGTANHLAAAVPAPLTARSA